MCGTSFKCCPAGPDSRPAGRQSPPIEGTGKVSEDPMKNGKLRKFTWHSTVL